MPSILFEKKLVNSTFNLLIKDTSKGITLATVHEEQVIDTNLFKECRKKAINIWEQ